MKIVIIGGTGLIGSKLVEKLTARGHQAVPAAPNTGVDTLTGAGLSEVLEGADVVVDVSNSPSFADDDRAHIVGNAASYTERLPTARRVRPVVRRPLPPAGLVPGDDMS